MNPVFIHMKRSEYLKLRRILVKKASSYGVMVSFRRVKFYRNSFGVYGSYSSMKKKIYVNISGNASYIVILAVLAHEFRHAEHHYLGLFPEYYNPDFESKDFIRRLKSGEVILPDINIGTMAENDCNLFAREFLKEHGHILIKERKTHLGFFEYLESSTLIARLKRLQYSS